MSLYSNGSPKFDRKTSEGSNFPSDGCDESSVSCSQIVNYAESLWSISMLMVLFNLRISGVQI